MQNSAHAPTRWSLKANEQILKSSQSLTSLLCRKMGREGKKKKRYQLKKKKSRIVRSEKRKKERRPTGRAFAFFSPPTLSTAKDQLSCFVTASYTACQSLFKAKACLPLRLLRFITLSDVWRKRKKKRTFTNEGRLWHQGERKEEEKNRERRPSVPRCKTPPIEASRCTTFALAKRKTAVFAPKRFFFFFFFIPLCLKPLSFSVLFFFFSSNSNRRREDQHVVPLQGIPFFPFILGKKKIIERKTT